MSLFSKKIWDNSKFYVMHKGGVTPLVTKCYSWVCWVKETKCLALLNYWMVYFRNFVAVGARNILVPCIQATISKWSAWRIPQIPAKSGMVFFLTVLMATNRYLLLQELHLKCDLVPKSALEVTINTDKTFRIVILMFSGGIERNQEHKMS